MRVGESGFFFVNKMKQRPAPGVEAERLTDKKIIELAKAGRGFLGTYAANELMRRAKYQAAEILRDARGD